MLAGANGDGYMYYPGIAASNASHSIGGSTDIPIESARLKHVRDGYEDFEWLTILEKHKGRAFVLELISPFITNSWTFADNATTLLSVRSAVGAAIEAALQEDRETSVAQAAQKNDDDNVRILHMATDGADSNKGRSKAEAVKTLNGVQWRVHNLLLLDSTTPIEVHIHPGTYWGQQTKWPSNFTMEAASITFKPAPSDAAAASSGFEVTFDGCLGPDGPCEGGTFFDVFLKAPGQGLPGVGRSTNLNIERLHLTNYSQGVIFTGLRGSHGHKHDMNGPDFALRHNTVKDCWFERMGNVFNTSLCPCCGAVALVHTHDSTFTGNLFTDIIGIQRGTYLGVSRHNIATVWAAFFSR